MPTDLPSAKTGRKGLRFIEDTVEDMDFIFRDMPQPDVGIDGQIELKEGNSPTGQFILVQSKAGRSHMQNPNPNTFDYYSDPNHLVYWKNCGNAVILVIYDPEEKMGFWKHVQGYLRQHPDLIEKRPHKITFDREHDRFTPDCAESLRALFGPNQSAMEKAFCEHVISKHSKLTLYSVTSDRPLSVALERVFVTLTAHRDRMFEVRTDTGVGKIQARFGTGKSFSAAALTIMFRKGGLSALPEESATTLSFNTALHDHRSLVVIGDPGTGKTTLLKFVALAFARDLAKERLELEEHRIPILVALRDFNVFLKNTISRKELDTLGPSVLPKFLHKYFTETAAHLKLSDDFFPMLLDSGRCAVLLDGLDEVADPTDRARMARLVSNIISVAAWGANRFVVTSRPRGFEGEPRACLSPHCANCAICPFEDKDVEQFTLAWYQAVTFDRLGETPEAVAEAATRARSLTNAVKSEPRVRALAQNPLLLSVLAMVHQRNVELPRQREKLYEECTIFLLGYWDESKERESATDLARLGGLTREQKRSLLEPVALRLHERGADGMEIERAELEEQFTAHFIEQGRTRAEAKQRATEVLDVIVERSGLLVERSSGVFAFAHLTFQEYLAARAIMDRDDYVEFTLIHLHDPWWREVILLEAGLLADTRSGEKTARRRTHPFLEGIRKAGSWKEEILHRDLLFAVRCLGDTEAIGVEEDLRQRFINEAIALWKKTKWDNQRAEVNAAFANAANTPHGQRFIATLLSFIQENNDDVRMAAVSALGGLGSAATPAVLHRLLSLIQDTNDKMRWTAVDALHGLGSTAATPAVLDRLLSLSQDINDDVRWAAVNALGRLGSAAATPAALDRLLSLIQDTNDKMRRAAVGALGRLGSVAATPAVLDRLLSSIQGTNDDVRWAAVDALGRLGSAAATPAVLDRLLSLSQDTNDNLRPVVVRALGRLGSTATLSVLDHLLSLIKDTNDNVRWAALDALGSLGSTAATPAVLDRLLSLSQDINDDVRWAAVNALGRLGSAAATPAALDRLLSLIQDTNDDVRWAAVATLGELRSAAATPAVLDRVLSLTQDTTDTVGHAAAGALGGLGSAAATPAVLDRLLSLTQDTSAGVRCTAVLALGQIKVPGGLAEKKLVKFWEKRLREKGEVIFGAGFGTLGDFAYSQLQRLAAQQERLPSAAISRPSVTPAKRKKAAKRPL